MAHERQVNTVEELANIEKMLEKRIDEIDQKRTILVEELRLVREKKDRLAKGEA